MQFLPVSKELSQKFFNIFFFFHADLNFPSFNDSPVELLPGAIGVGGVGKGDEAEALHQVEHQGEVGGEDGGEGEHANKQTCINLKYLAQCIFNNFLSIIYQYTRLRDNLYCSCA